MNAATESCSRCCGAAACPAIPDFYVKLAAIAGAIVSLRMLRAGLFGKDAPPDIGPVPLKTRIVAVLCRLLGRRRHGRPVHGLSLRPQQSTLGRAHRGRPDVLGRHVAARLFAGQGLSAPAEHRAERPDLRDEGDDMDAFLRTWLDGPRWRRSSAPILGVAALRDVYFFGIILLMAACGCSTCVPGDRQRPPAGDVSKRFIPGGRYGFTLCVVTGVIFVTRMRANVPSRRTTSPERRAAAAEAPVHRVRGPEPVAFYATGMSRAVDGLRPGDDARRLRK